LPRSIKFWINLRKAIAELGPFDIIHLNSFNYFFLDVRRLAPCPHLMTIHHLAHDAHQASGWGILETFRNPASEDGFLIPIVERSCAKTADAFVAVSEYSRQRAINIYNLNEKRVHTILNGISRLQEPRQGDVALFKKKLDIPEGPLLFFAGRFDDYRKGIDILVSAMEELDERVMLLIVGKGDRLQLMDKLRTDMRGRVFFSGFIEEKDLPSAYGCSDICVIPSRMEGFSLTAMNAMVEGKPIVSSDAGALPEVIGDPDQLFESGNPRDLAMKLNKFLQDGKFARHKGERNKAWVTRFKHWDEVAAKVVEVYNLLINQSLTATPIPVTSTSRSEP
jgi:glycosyltransferase involved in cell wall biosynthesis